MNYLFVMIKKVFFYFIFISFLLYNIIYSDVNKEDALDIKKDSGDIAILFSMSLDDLLSLKVISSTKTAQ